MKICMKCGYESPDNKRICPKCGMPLTDATVRPDAEDEDARVIISKRIMELTPIAEKQAEEKRKRREEEKKKKEEEKAALLAALTEDSDDDEEGDAWDDPEAETIDKLIEAMKKSDEDADDEAEEEFIKKSKKKKELKWEILDDGDENPVLSIASLIDDKYMFDGTDVTVEGSVCFISMNNDLITINLENDDDSVSCSVDLADTEVVNHEDMSFTKEEILSNLSYVKHGDVIKITGHAFLDDNGDMNIDMTEVEGSDFYVRCAE